MTTQGAPYSDARNYRHATAERVNLAKLSQQKPWGLHRGEKSGVKRLSGGF